MTTITWSSYTITPTIVDGYSAERVSQNIVRTILGNPVPSIALRPPLLRRGTLSLVFGGAGAEAASLDAVNVHALAGVLTLSETTRTSLGMQYVVSGSITRNLDDQTRDVWVVTVDFQEV